MATSTPVLRGVGRGGESARGARDRRRILGARVRRGVLALALAGIAPACSAPLPEAESPDARLYEAQCGICHRAYAPNLLKPSMWVVQMERMQARRMERGLPPLSPEDNKRILDYLTRHAG